MISVYLATDPTDVGLSPPVHHLVRLCGCGQRKYRTVGNLREKTFRKLVKKMVFTEKTFAGCSHLLCQRTPRPKFHTEKTLVYSHKTVKLAKFFSLEGFPLYGRSETVAVDVQCVVDETNVLIALE